jgi:hypothetical protein
MQIGIKNSVFQRKIPILQLHSLQKLIFNNKNQGSVDFLTPGSGMSKKSGSGSGIRDEQPGSYFRELKSQFFGLKLKYLNSLMWIRDVKNSEPGSGM